MNYKDIIKRPIITEKSMELASRGVYVFEVGKFASKGLVKEAVEKLFGVTVKKVRTLSLPGKEKRSLVGKRLPYRKGGLKKAIVELQENQKIDLFDIKDGS